MKRAVVWLPMLSIDKNQHPFLSFVFLLLSFFYFKFEIITRVRNAIGEVSDVVLWKESRIACGMGLGLCCFHTTAINFYLGS